MNKKISHHISLLIAATFVVCLSTSALAEIEWSIVDRIALEDSPLDIAISRDGETVYILCEKNILIYSPRQNKVTDTIPLTGKFSQIALAPEEGLLLLTDAKEKQVSIIQISQVYDIEIGQSPIIGKADAPVNVFAFVDYQ
jgi:DNA-binding beta-propeller fold protein YncE